MSLLAAAHRRNSGGGAAFTDDFNRADADPMSDPASGGTWTIGPGALNNVKIATNECLPSSSATAGARVLTPSFATNQSAEITIGSASTKHAKGAYVRMPSSTSGNGYLAYAGSLTGITIYKMTDTGSMSSAALGASFTVASLVAGDRIKLTAAGTGTVTLELFVNDVSQGTRTDSSSPYDSGQPGLYFGSTSSSVDSFTATDL